MANLVRGGFHPRRGLKATPNPRRYEIASSYGTAIFPGDVVTLVTAGTIEACTAGGAPLILGVVAHVSYVSNNKRVYGQYVPATTVYSPTARGSANASYAYVWDDPSIEYIANLASHANTATAALIYAAVGANMDLVATAGSTVYGRSGHQLDGNPIAGTAQFRINEVLRSPANDLASANAQVACSINEGFHVFTSAAGI
jgi:hypothetical protein